MTWRPLIEKTKPNLSFNFIFFYTILLHRGLELLVQKYNIPCLVLFLVLFWCPYMAINVSVQSIPVVITLFVDPISLIADGPHHYHPACGHKGSSHLSPVHALQFLSRCKFSTLTTHQPMVEFYLLTFPRFPLRKKEHKPTLVRIELTSSALAGVQVTY